MPIQVYQKKNTLLPALEMFAKYLAPIAEQKQLATLSQGQSDIYKNVKDPIELAQVHSQYIEQLNSNSDISAQNKQQLLQNANMYVGLKEGQLKEFKRVQTANTIADFMTGEVSKKKLVWKGQLVQGDIVAKELQQLSNGDPEVYAKMVEQAAQSGAVKYDTGIGYDDRGSIVGTSGYTDAQGNPYETQTGIIREYQTKNGKVLYTDKNADNTFNKGEGLNSRDAAEYGKMLQYEKKQKEAQERADRQFNIQLSRMDRQGKDTVTQDMFVNEDSKLGFAKGDRVLITVKKEYDEALGGYVATYHMKNKDGKWQTVPQSSIDRTKTYAGDYKDQTLAEDAKQTQYEMVADKRYKQAVSNLLATVKPLLGSSIATEDLASYSDFNQGEGLYISKYRNIIYDEVIADIEEKQKNKESLTPTEQDIITKWHAVRDERRSRDMIQRGKSNTSQGIPKLDLNN